jgi:hypothetical protein
MGVTSEVLIENSVINRGVYAGGFIPAFEWRVPKMGSLKWLNLGAAFLQRSVSNLRI